MPPAAKRGDTIEATDIHIELVPAAAGAPVPTPTPHTFRGIIDNALSDNVFIDGQSAATMGSTATNTPPHIFKAGPFQRPPSNQGRIFRGSRSVTINGKAAARDGDVALTCNDPVDAPVGTVRAASNVRIGG